MRPAEFDPPGWYLGIQHSAFSRALRDLEAWLGVPLLDKRDGQRALAFTAEGAALGKAALAAMNELQSVVTSTREGSNANSVTLATTPSCAMRFLEVWSCSDPDSNVTLGSGPIDFG